MKNIYLLGFIFLIISCFNTFAQPSAAYPTGFYEETIGVVGNVPTGIEFDSQNRIYVCEKTGYVYKFENGVQTLLIDIQEETSVNGDEGLLSIALDPNFINNGYIYLYYVVDRHHLFAFGTASYNPSYSEPGATIGRVTRYTVNTNNGFNSVDPNSRFILLGETKSTGFPFTGQHNGGTIKFGKDGTLLVSVGDGSLGSQYELQGYQDQIISNIEYTIGQKWRSQSIHSLNGKIVRINPLNGNGIPSNPYYNPAQPRAPESRVWALGLRNPFRMAIKPNTGSTDPTLGEPGTIYFGDVGQDTKEEINVVTSPGQNFGWPRFEGIDFIYESNPPYHPAVHTPPTIEWGRAGSNARVKVSNNILNVNSTSFPSSNFTGGGSMGGVFYPGSLYPTMYQNRYFFAEFNDKWFRSVQIDQDDNPVSINEFNSSIPGLIVLNYNPYDQCLYYGRVGGFIRKIAYNSNINQNPVANFTLNTNYGPSGTNISFDASTSSDPESSALSYSWNFGDNTYGSGSNINHVFNAPNSSISNFNVTLTVTDNQGATHSLAKTVSINNTPPTIDSTSLSHIESFLTNPLQTIPLNATTSDAQSSNSQLSYKWEAFLVHNQHRHPDFLSNNLNTSFTLGFIPCDNVLYYYKFILTATDPQGLSTIYQKNIFPNCNTNDTTPPSSSAFRAENIASNSLALRWTTPSDNYGIKNIEILINGITKTFLTGNHSEYIYNSGPILIGTTTTAQFIVRDFAGNQFISPKLFIVIPNISVLPYDALAPTSPSNILLSSSYQLTWNPSTDNIDTYLLYNIYIDGLFFTSTYSNIVVLNNLPPFSKSLTIQAVDDYGNTIVSNDFPITVCPPIRAFTNAAQNNFQNQTLTFAASQSISATNKILSNSNITYQAGQSIILNPGFAVSQGNVFLVKIQGCN